MSKLVFSLKDVPHQEADDIRELLTSHNIDWYETSEGRWRISVAAIWLVNDADYEHARQLINQYQAELLVLRSRQNELSDTQPKPPWVIVLYSLAIIIVLALTFVPFFRMS